MLDWLYGGRPESMTSQQKQFWHALPVWEGLFIVTKLLGFRCVIWFLAIYS